ncbi:MAG TPA: indolepyruvate oxidoreductase subunit beta family protein [Thermodesulfobacteriota bacterium]|nr:indolepyruvate oxidoreductase subunit beta family protein [Thermodesulfobacteriota bacterium]
MKRKSELLKILIPAVGGQGGGVLTEWLVQAFMIEGFDVQGISLPGLSQRGGSTVYYIEAHPRTSSDKRRVIFSQYPIPGDVDVILSQEFLELGRVLEQGYGSEKTTIVSSTHRIYSTLEKMPVSSGMYSDDNLKKLAINFSSQFIGLDALKLVKENGMDELGINALLFGALAASEALPLNEASYLKAIEGTEVAVKSNLKAFRIGWDYVKFKKYDSFKPGLQKKWEGFKRERAERLDTKKKEDYLRLVARAEIEYSTRLHEILGEALFRLIDYQDVWYAEKYLSDLKSVYEIDQEMKGGFKLSELFAKNLALWMTYEDGIRVAELKIRPERFKRIKQEMRLRDDQVFHVVDYLKPDAYEIYGLLPNAFVGPVIRLIESRVFRRLLPEDKKITLEQKPVTTSFLGSVRLWLISKLKPVRHYSYRYHKEHSLIQKYKANVEKFACINYDLGCLVAKSGEMIKGYGDVRRRTMNAFSRFLDNIITPLSEFERKKKKNFDLTLEIGEKSLKLIAGATVDGIDNAEKMANDVLRGRAA